MKNELGDFKYGEINCAWEGGNEVGKEGRRKKGKGRKKRERNKAL